MGAMRKVASDKGGHPPAILLVAALCISVVSFLAGQHAASGVPAKTNRHQHSSNLRASPLLRGSSGHGQIIRPIGRHIILDMYEIPGHRFSATADTEALLRQVAQAIQQSAMTLLGHSCYEFEGTLGITCVFLLSESHLSIHTWPEHKYAAADIFTCGKAAKPEVLERALVMLLDPGLTLRQEHLRGGLDMTQLTREQRQAKTLHTMRINNWDDEGLQQLLYQVPILHSSKSPYQSIEVVEVPGQMGRCLMLNRIIQYCSHDLDAYTDHMARQSLQMLQQLHGCRSAGSSRIPVFAPAAARSGVAGSTLQVELPLAASNPNPLLVSCHAHLLSLQPGADSVSGVGNTTTTKSSDCGQLHRRKAHVLMVGGGDGWIAKHLVGCYTDWVSHVHVVEIDRAVSDVTHQYFGSTGNSSSSSGGNSNPFNHPRIHWEYTDAFAWAVEHATRCGAGGKGALAGGSVSSLNPVSTTSNSSRTGAAQAARTRRETLPGSSTISSRASQERHLSSWSDCAPFDAVIIDSTDFGEEAASHLHSAAFYRTLYRLMSPKASLIQLVEVYVRAFEGPFAKIEAAMQEGGWKGAGRSSVYTPSYGGETVFLQAVKV